MSMKKPKFPNLRVVVGIFILMTYAILGIIGHFHYHTETEIVFSSGFYITMILFSFYGIMVFLIDFLEWVTNG